MAFSRYDNERLRAIEEHLKDEDPDYVRRLERSAGDLPEESNSPEADGEPKPTFVLVCAWIIGALVLLFTMAATADVGNRDFASTPKSAPNPPAVDAPAVQDPGVTRRRIATARSRARRHRDPGAPHRCG